METPRFRAGEDEKWGAIDEDDKGHSQDKPDGATTIFDQLAKHRNIETFS